jgi:hypothetical protein
MFKKLFGQKSVPNEVGTSTPKLEGSRWVKSYQLELSNMEETPVYDLAHELTVGSEIGNIVVSDPSISPRHATFTLKDDVVSVIDHGSATGTFVNNNPIPTGRVVLLEQGDIIRIGDLEIKLLASNKTIDERDVPDVPDTNTVTESELSRKAPEPNSESAEELSSIKRTPKTQTKKKTTPKNESSFGMSSKEAANALVRVGGMIGDVLLAYLILIIFMPFVEFQTYLEDVPSTFFSLIQVDPVLLWNQLSTTYPEPSRLAADFAEFVTSAINIVPLIITYGSVRLLSTLIMGVTISQAILGIRAQGHPLWKRVGGVLRTLIGFVTWPFLIFDFTAVSSRRTFKEKMTNTHLVVPSKAVSFLGAVIYFPLLIFALLVGPFFQGLEVQEPIALDTKIDERIVVAEDEAKPQATPTPTPSPTANAEGEVVAVTPEAAAPLPPAPPVTTTSQHLGFTLTYTTDEMDVFPAFRFVGEKNKLKAQGDAILVIKEPDMWSAELSLLKSFDLKQLIGLGIEGNFFLYERYPHLYDFVYSATTGSSYFKSKKDQKSQEEFAKEFIDLCKTSFELSSDNLIHTMQVRSPFIKSFIDFRSSFFQLIEYKDYRAIGFARIGDAIFMRLSYQKQRPFDLLIPLVPGQGRLYKVTYEKDYGKDQKSYANKIYKYALFGSKWSPDKTTYLGETLTPLEVIDALTVDFKTQRLSSERAQALYGFFYEKTTEVLKQGNAVEMNLWKDSIDSVLKMIKAIPLSENNDEEDPVKKLLQNMQDLHSAFENKNQEFFGISTVQNV